MCYVSIYSEKQHSIREGSSLRLKVIKGEVNHSNFWGGGEGKLVKVLKVNRS